MSTNRVATPATNADPILASVIANRFKAITAEMNEALMRSARSALIAVCRDMSGAILTRDAELVAVANSLPGHMLGTSFQVRCMNRRHPDPRPGDAFLHNDPYEGATHPADWVIMVPVFAQGQHCFTVALLAHQADIGNSLPTTYMTQAKDVYEEGALIFSATQVQRDYEDIDDITTMCRRRLRSPDEWYGDYRAMIGAARLAEGRVSELVDRYGLECVLENTRWMADYGERMMAEAISRLPAGRAVYETRHDPAGEAMPDGYRVKVEVEVEPDAGLVTVDLRDNADCLDNGLNLSENTATMAAVQGVLNCIPDRLPLNGGTFRRVRVLLREGCAVGKPTFPHSCSVATTNLLCRVTMAVHGAFAAMAPGAGIAESGLGMSAGWGVISGRDDRRNGSPFYVNQLFTGFAGGPATSEVDGWVNSGSTGGFAMNLRDSIEVLEAKYPVLVHSLRVVPGSGGAGRRRGAPGEELCFSSRSGPMGLGVAADGHVYPPRGVRGGLSGMASATYLQESEGDAESELPGLVDTLVPVGARVRSVDNGGGGYGPPLDREPERVLRDVLDGFETVERASDAYGVVLTGSLEKDDLTVDVDATEELRALRRSEVAGNDQPLEEAGR